MLEHIYLCIDQYLSVITFRRDVLQVGYSLLSLLYTLDNNYIHFNILLFYFAHYHHQIHHLTPLLLYQQVSGDHCIVSTKLDNNNT